VPKAPKAPHIPLAERRKIKADAEFDEMMKGEDEEAAIAYDMHSSFHRGVVVNHNSFGLGKVEEIITPDKMVVNFKEGQKILMCVVNTDFAGK